MSYPASGPLVILSFFRNRWVRRAVSVGMIFLLVALAQSVLTLWNKKDIVTERRQELVQLEAENQKLKDRLAESQTPSFVERVARETLGLVKEGETMVILGRTQNSEPNDQTKAEENLPNWKKWWRLFF